MPTIRKDFAAFFFLVFAGCVSAHAGNQSASASQVVSSLVLKAEHAQPKERCFVYAELVSSLAELASQQVEDGEGERALETLKSVQSYAEKIESGLAVGDKKTKNAEQMIGRATLRVDAILHSASFEDRQFLEGTLKKLEKVQTDLMLEVFKK